MASDDLKDSGYVSVRGTRSQLQWNESNDSPGAYSTDMSNLQSVKQLNKNLFLQIKILKEEINGFKAEKKNLTETHKRDIDSQKNETKKILAKQNQIQKREALCVEEIKRLKGELEFLEKTEIELRVKIKMLEATEYKHQYEKERREMAASNAEIMELKEQIAVLEQAATERDEQIVKAQEENSVIKEGFKEMAEKHEADMALMKSDLLYKMEENDKGTKEMLYNLQRLLVAEKEEQPSVDGRPRVQPNNVLPPINTPRSSSQVGSKPTYWKP